MKITAKTSKIHIHFERHHRPVSAHGALDAALAAAPDLGAAAVPGGKRLFDQDAIVSIDIDLNTVIDESPVDLPVRVNDVIDIDLEKPWVRYSRTDTGHVIDLLDGDLIQLNEIDDEHVGVNVTVNALVINGDFDPVVKAVEAGKNLIRALSQGLAARPPVWVPGCRMPGIDFSDRVCLVCLQETKVMEGNFFFDDNVAEPDEEMHRLPDFTNKLTKPAEIQVRMSSPKDTLPKFFNINRNKERWTPQ